VEKVVNPPRTPTHLLEAHEEYIGDLSWCGVQKNVGRNVGAPCAGRRVRPGG